MRYKWCKRSAHLSRYWSLVILLAHHGERIQHHREWDLRWPPDHEEDVWIPNTMVSTDQPLLVEQTLMYYCCHIWVCHEVDMHKLLHICILPIHPPTRQILPFDTWCKAFPPTPSLQRNNSREKKSGPWCGASFCDCQSIPTDLNINLRIMRNQGARVQGLFDDMHFTNWQCFSNVKQPLVGGTLQCWRDVISTNTITISPSSLQLTLKHLDISCLAILRGRVISPNNILNGPETGGRGRDFAN